MQQLKIICYFVNKSTHLHASNGYLKSLFKITVGAISITDAGLWSFLPYMEIFTPILRYKPPQFT